MFNKKSSWKNSLLWFIIFFHLSPVIISAYYDRGIQTIRYGNSINFNEARYWLWFFTWWSAWASLLTIPWAIYKLFICEKEDSYGNQLGDIIITQTNLISGIVFCSGGFILSYPTHSQTLITYPLFGQLKTIHVYIFYNLFWHIIAPALVFYYFWKYSKIDKLKKNLDFSLMANLINPTIYFAYVILRPAIASYYPKNGSNKPHTYPRDYPYPFFFWSTGKFASGKEEANQWFWQSWPKWSQILFWSSMTFFISYLGFSLLLKYLIKFKTYKEKNFWKETQNLKHK